MKKESCKTVAIVQSSYIPWKGYFDLIQQADEFVLLDDVEYTGRSWRNRNRIKTFQGLHWLTIPVKSAHGSRPNICEIEISNRNWPEEHWTTILHHYSRAGHFSDFKGFFSALYESVVGETSLSSVNHKFLTAILDLLNVPTRVRWSMQFPKFDDPSLRLLRICQACGAETYLSGPAARAYLDLKLFERGGVNVRFMDYSGYPEYRQLHGRFVHEVSIIDLILNEGSKARSFIRAGGGGADEQKA